MGLLWLRGLANGAANGTLARLAVGALCSTLGWSQTTNPSKEYVYLGARVLAIETSGATAGDVRALLNSPTPGGTLTSRTINFGWSAATGASNLELKVGTTPGAQDVYFANGIAGTALSQQVVNIPCLNNQTGLTTIHVSLRTQIGTVWQPASEANYGAPAASLCSGGTVAELRSPTPGSPLGSTSINFVWDAGANATNYWLDVGTQPGIGNISAGATTALSKSSAVLCADSTSTIWVRLWTFANGAWVQPPKDYQFVPPPASACANEVRATLTSPVENSTLTTRTQTFTWNKGVGAQGYPSVPT